MNLLDPQKSSADVRVEKTELASRVWTVDGDVLLKFLAEDPVAGYAVMKLLAKEMSRRLRQNSDHMLHKADQLRTHFLDIDY
jgi:CRP-like cAMP-binding protein